MAVFTIVFQCIAQPMKTTVIGNANFSYTAHTDSLAKKQHLIAIAPPSVSIETSEELPSRFEQQRTESTDFQIEIYNQMLKKKITEVSFSFAIYRCFGIKF